MKTYFVMTMVNIGIKTRPWVSSTIFDKEMSALLLCSYVKCEFSSQNHRFYCHVDCGLWHMTMFRSLDLWLWISVARARWRMQFLASAPTSLLSRHHRVLPISRHLWQTRLNISSFCISSGWALARTCQGQQWMRVCGIWSGFHSENPITWYWQ